jgi:hypothetical protein
MAEPYRIGLIACSPEQSPMAYPLGALCIQTALMSHPTLAHHIEVELQHFIGDTDDPIEAAKIIAQKHIPLVGLSLYLYNRNWFDQFIDHLFVQAPYTTIFAGGPEALAHADHFIQRGLSFIILGEGEESVCTAVEQILAGQEISGRGIYTDQSRMLIPAYPADLSSLTSVLLSQTVSVDDYQGVLWEMTRGCPYHCAFCFESRGNRRVRSYPMGRIIQELELLIEHHVTHVFVLDPTFNLNRERTITILNLLRERVPSDMHFTFEVRAELLDEQTAYLFSTFHSSLQIGLQSSNPSVLSGIGRSFQADLFSQKIALLNQYGVVFGLDLIIGLPQDTLQSFKESLNFAVSCKPSNIDIFVLAVLPGTQLAEDAQHLHLHYLPESPYLLQSSPTMDEKEIAATIRLKEACDLLYTAGHAVMWFGALCDVLECTPADVFAQFATYTEQYPITDDEDIFSVQEQFVRNLCGAPALQPLLPILLSYMELHQGISYLQETAEAPVVHLWYTPDELTELDSIDVRTFHSRFTASKESVAYLVFSEEETVYVEPLV